MVHYEWRERSDDPKRHYLFRNGIQIGGWDYDKCFYRPLINGQWSSQTFKEAPFTVPGIEVGKESVISQNGEQFKFGVDRSKLSGKDEYSINGKRCHPRKVFDAMAADQLTDDSGKPWLIVIGNDAERKAVADAWASPACDAVREQFRVWSVPADHWSVDDEGFAKGSPAISWEKSDGKVLYRQTKFMSAEQLATVSKGALRKADPKYDPKKDADPLAPQPEPKPAPAPKPDNPQPVSMDWLSWLKQNWVLPAMLACVVAVVVFSKRKPA